ncbi:MAG: exopolysaccharide biosynthesis polyprenyl glycosylphosphotransferase [Verrucomicrobiales bacterium]|jgi:exopolysaccharide biosynthesis polyprenyl glycosylphosphotransferase
MLARKEEISLQLNQIIDSFLLAIAFWFSWWFRTSLTEWGYTTVAIKDFRDFLWVMAIVVPFTPLVLEYLGFYFDPLQKRVWDSMRQMGQALIYFGAAIGGAEIFFRMENESRAVLIIFGCLGGSLLLIRERGYQAVLRHQLRAGRLRQPVVLIGMPEDIEAVFNAIPLEQRMEMDLVARFDVRETNQGELIQVLHDKSVSRVIFAAEHVHFNEVAEALAACEAEGVEVWVAADFFQTSIARPDFQMIGGKPMLVFRSTPEVSWALLLKNLFDRLAALILIVVTSPIWIFAAIGIRLSSKGAIIFDQERGGLYGRPFTMYKFRTMVPDAEAKQVDLEGANQMSGPVFKLENDPRIFPFGRLLRRTSIDELPQLLNVAFGQMSLVGPRPLPSYEVAKIEQSSQRRRLSVKPGITCLWQIGGRNRITDFDEWVALDLEYIDNWSLWLDAKILMKTVPVVVWGSGAS